MATPATPKKAPASRAPRAPKPPVEVDPVDALVEAQDARAEQEDLLADMPALRPATRFRLRHTNAFQEIMLDATSKGVFDDAEDGLTLDPKNPEDVAKLKVLNALCADIDEFAESIAEDPLAYEKWAEGKKHGTFIAILNRYNEALGESAGSEN